MASRPLSTGTDMELESMPASALPAVVHDQPSTTIPAASVRNSGSLSMQSSHQSTRPPSTDSVAVSVPVSVPSTLPPPLAVNVSQNNSTQQSQSPNTASAIPPRANSNSNSAFQGPISGVSAVSQTTLPTHARPRDSRIYNALATIARQLSSLLSPFLATLIFVLTAYLALTVIISRGPLVRLSPGNGTLVLNLLSKATDYAFLAAAGVSYDRIHWGSMIRNGEKMLSYFVMTSGIPAWLKVLFLKKKTQQQTSQVTGQLAQSKKSLMRRIGWAEHPRRLSFIRIATWILLQFPGIVLMTIISPQTSYEAIKYTPIGGGLGVFNSSLVSKGLISQRASHLVLNFNTDRKYSIESEAEHPECKKAGPNCTSLLIPGGLQVVTPWPSRLDQDSISAAYITKNAPAYQIDTWPGPRYGLWQPGECSLYGIDNSTSFQLCMTTRDQNPGIFIAGWRYCNDNLLSDGECSSQGSWGNVSTISHIFAFYRRPATIAARRSDSQILSILNLAPTEQQTIAPADFNISFNALLSPYVFNRYYYDPSPSQFCTMFGTASLLTVSIYTDLMQSLNGGISANAQYILLNIFATSLYLFNNMTTTIQRVSPTEIQKDLVAENLVMGSFARIRTFVAPRAWTVYAYLGSAGALLMLIYVALLATVGYGVTLSSFMPITNSKVVWRKADGSSGGQTDQIATRLPTDLTEDPAQDGLSDREVIDRAANWRVGLMSDAVRGQQPNGV